ncbi:MAG: hypothetical protein GY827_04560 [Cytophagales bacterium]|nr:hypothetical protein [Cytophagales bacterium]
MKVFPLDKARQESFERRQIHEIDLFVDKAQTKINEGIEKAVAKGSLGADIHIHKDCAWSVDTFDMVPEILEPFKKEGYNIEWTHDPLNTDFKSYIVKVRWT